MKTQKLFVANWKMNMPADRAMVFATTHSEQMDQLAKKTEQRIVICPSFESIFPLQQIFKGTLITIGAQNCSDHLVGAFTSQVSAESLNNLECTHCIIGHSECRTHLGETSTQIAKKFSQLLDFAITPILCVGESEADFKGQKTIDALTAQLRPIFDLFTNKQAIGHNHLTPYIAYEPTWSIGTNAIAPVEHLEMVFAWLHEFCQKHGNPIAYKFMYGGSLNLTSLPTIKNIPFIEGFLIGKASLDFQEFEKIVQLSIVS